MRVLAGVVAAVEPDIVTLRLSDGTVLERIPRSSLAKWDVPYLADGTEVIAPAAAPGVSSARGRRRARSTGEGSCYAVFLVGYRISSPPEPLTRVGAFKLAERPDVCANSPGLPYFSERRSGGLCSTAARGSSLKAIVASSWGAFYFSPDGPVFSYVRLTRFGGAAPADRSGNRSW